MNRARQCLVAPNPSGETLISPTVAPPILYIRKLRTREGKGFIHEPPGLRRVSKEGGIGWKALWLCIPAALKLNPHAFLD